MRNLLIFCLVVFFTSLIYSQRYIPPPEWQVHNNETRAEAGLYKHIQKNIFLKVIDLRFMEVDILLGDIENMNYSISGTQYPNSPNPDFKMLSMFNIRDEYEKLYGNKYFSIMNGSYIREYVCDETKISYPIKAGNVIVTGGDDSSSYTYHSLNFRVSGSSATITNYTPSTGQPLFNTFYNDALVAFHPSDPNDLWGSDLYPIFGLLDIDSNNEFETLLILFDLENDDPERARRYLTHISIGVNENNLFQLDGGGSLFLAGSKSNNPYISPTIFPFCIPEGRRRVNSYLGFRVKGQTKEEEDIEVLNPNSNDLIYTNTPYIILWRDNIENNVQLQLLKNGQFVQTLPPNGYDTESDGVFRWIPDDTLSPGNDYKIRVLPLPYTRFVYDDSEEFEIINCNSDLVNGDFELGNIGFITQYIYNPSSGQSAQRYTVTDNPQVWHSSFSACSDHTPSPGTEMMVINGATSSNITVWQQTVCVNPNTNYNFSGYATSVYSSSPANLRFYINGVSQGTLQLTSTTCPWSQFNFQWGSGSSDTAQLRIVDLNTVSTGNDFALDDISFTESLTKQNSLEEIGNLSKSLNFEIKNYPNPFNPSTIITYSIPELDQVRLTIYDVLGREVSLLVNEQKEAGEYSVTFDAGNLPSGTYFYRLETTRNVKTDKMILLK